MPMGFWGTMFNPGQTWWEPGRAWVNYFRAASSCCSRDMRSRISSVCSPAELEKLHAQPDCTNSTTTIYAPKKRSSMEFKDGRFVLPIRMPATAC